jgi:hypothetical protein
MTARTFLINGLIAGLLAGFATFLVAHTVGEPPVDAAIAIEESHDHGHHHEEGGTVVSRENQSTWGLLTGTLAIGTAFGGLVALAAAGAVGRVGRLRPSQSTALVALIGFVAVALVPFLKYPASPPAVGNPDTIGERTGLFFGFLAISLLAAIASTVLASRLLPGLGTYRSVGIATGGYLVVVVVAAQLMPTVDELGSFPAQTLWTFRRASITTLAAMWATIGFVLVGLVGRAHQRAAVEAARRELAASL